MLRVAAVVAFLVFAVVSSSGGGAASVDRTVLRSAAAPAAVAAPRFVRNIAPGETGWFRSPGLVDLDGDRKLEIVAPFYSTFVFDAKGRPLGKGTATQGPGLRARRGRRPRRRRASRRSSSAATRARWRRTSSAAGACSSKPGWPASTCSGGQCPEARGLAAADLDGDGRIEVVVTTTNTSPTGSQVFVFDARARLPAEGRPATPGPATTAAGKGNDADFNGAGNHGYGAYGENVGIGNLDDDPQLEIVVTFDNHQINVFNHDGTSVLASPVVPQSRQPHAGRAARLGPVHPLAEPGGRGRHYHRHVGAWPTVTKTMWLQWTASPPSIADLDRDGRNEVIGLPNAEMKEPYETQALRVHGARRGVRRRRRSARRHAGFVTLPLSGKPAVRPDGDWYPPSGIPAPTVVDIAGDGRAGDRRRRCPTASSTPSAPTGKRLWRYDYARGRREDVRLGGRRRRPQPRRHARARLRHLRARARRRPARRALRRRASGCTTSGCRTREGMGTASAFPPPRRSATSTGRAPRDRAHDVRPRDRRLPRPGLGHEPPALADRTRKPSAQRDRSGDCALSYGPSSGGSEAAFSLRARPAQVGRDDRRGSRRRSRRRGTER